MNRDEFLERVRAAAASGRAYRVNAARLAAERRLCRRGRRSARATGGGNHGRGGQSHVVDDLDAARTKLAELLASLHRKAPSAGGIRCWTDRAGRIARGARDEAFGLRCPAPCPWKKPARR